MEIKSTGNDGNALDHFMKLLGGHPVAISLASNFGSECLEFLYY